jgi:hypothetical protein
MEPGGAAGRRADPRQIIACARQGQAPPHWQVFTKKRGAVGAFFTGTRNDPDPLLVVSGEAVVEYISESKPMAVVYFGDLAGVRLRGYASTMKDSMQASLHVWLDLRFHSGAKAKWEPSSFRANLSTVQGFLEGYGAFRARGPVW